MNFIIKNFNNSLKYVCKNQGGTGYSPKIEWSLLNNQNKQKIKSYALIMEDPDTPWGNYVHWYIPYISNDINIIDELDSNKINHFNNSLFIDNKINMTKFELFFGKNSSNNFGYHGPCAPEGTGIHRYIFTIYALDNILNVNKSNIKISGSKQFLDILNKQEPKINILCQNSKEYKYQYKMFMNK